MNPKRENPDAPASPPATAVAAKPKPAVPKPKPLPPWKVLLHNDEVHEFDYVIASIIMLTPLNEQEAAHRTLEAHLSGCALLLTAHRERAELYRDQFTSRGLTVTIEPAET